MLMWRARWPSSLSSTTGNRVWYSPCWMALTACPMSLIGLARLRARRRASRKVNSRANSARIPALITISCWRWLKASSDMPTITRPR
ncbi:hypothetical protein D3C73_1384650 [compost metagenome]